MAPKAHQKAKQGPQEALQEGHGHHHRHQLTKASGPERTPRSLEEAQEDPCSIGAPWRDPQGTPTTRQAHPSDPCGKHMPASQRHVLRTQAWSPNHSNDARARMTKNTLLFLNCPRSLRRTKGSPESSTSLSNQPCRASGTTAPPPILPQAYV